MDITPNKPSTQFLSSEESAQVDAALLSSPEKFLTRLTISSLRTLQHIAKEYDISIEELTTKQIITWFENDAKVRREKGIEEAFLKW
ncbi:MAG: hypothetical protein ACK5WC_16605 [Aphanizomenon sp.]|jgi:hypothetical protein|uniref:Uncharacterized protein n=1 Tax=Aphanizomenon flos-aquae LD13 TaxID=1710894 RepID=A0A1B7VVL6_APHFL|nr:hypothetical protein [Aphanizomenon flos-aquae UKL13-PB]OBQ24950.1 MAG: hypothetical protein AN481_12495 [Aphanizomenon flos-aquae LD13]OBQ29040.1 MAG: hypothetical protein AN483_12405 [Aphanizomenon flos-aquae MDT14a]HCQ21599.1 hypothetical protein [Anabaena sp. UBA12330]